MESSSPAQSFILLVARLVFGFLLMSHGIAKWLIFKDITETFPDPIGIGAELSFWLVLFAEVACSFGVMLGVLFRLCLIPVIFTLCIAVFVVHAGDPLVKVEPALMYLTIFTLMYFTGPGRLSIDGILYMMGQKR
jgi:putative oxidoreductase